MTSPLPSGDGLSGHRIQPYPKSETRSPVVGEVRYVILSVGTSPSAVTLLEEDVFRGEHPYNMAVDVAALIPAIFMKSLLFMSFLFFSSIILF